MSEETTQSPPEQSDGNGSRPTPTVIPGRPGGPRPNPNPNPNPISVAAAASAPSSPSETVVTPAVTPVDPHEWGRVDADGSVYLRAKDGERKIADWQAGDAEDGLAHFGRRFDDFNTEIALLEARLISGAGDPKADRKSVV